MIVVFGSVNFDYFIAAPDLPPTDTILQVLGYTTAFGGKGANQAVAAAKAGASVSMFGCVGKDAIGQSMVDNLAVYGIRTEGVDRTTDHPSGTAFIFTHQNNHRVIYARGANNSVSAASVPDQLLSKGSTVILQGDVPMRENEILLQRAKALGARTIVNLGPPPAPISVEALRCVDYLVVNQHEAVALEESLGVPRSKDPLEFATSIANAYSICVVVTLGKDGSIAVGPDGSRYQVPALPVDAIDMVGAGDAFIGHLAATIDRGEPINVALARGAIAGSLACTRHGAQSAVPTRDEVDNHLSQFLDIQGAMDVPVLEGERARVRGQVP